MDRKLEKAILDGDYEYVCKRLHTNHFEADSDFTIKRCDTSFIQGFKSAQEHFIKALLQRVRRLP